MFGIFSGNALWHLVTQSDLVTFFVLFFLLGLSVLCWTIFLCKIVLINLKLRDIRAMINRLDSAQTTEDVLSLATTFSGKVPGYFLSRTLTFLRMLLKAPYAHRSAEEKTDIMHYHIDQTINELVAHEESYLVVLSTSGAVAPLLGLFGTVWGLVHSFMSISREQVADITVVAPGIAQALVTTLAGLVVAIPALVIYNYLTSRIRAFEIQLTKLADRVHILMVGVLAK